MLPSTLLLPALLQTQSLLGLPNPSFLRSVPKDQREAGCPISQGAPRNCHQPVAERGCEASVLGACILGESWATFPSWGLMEKAPPPPAFLKSQACSPTHSVLEAGPLKAGNGSQAWHLQAEKLTSLLQPLGQNPLGCPGSGFACLPLSCFCLLPLPWSSHLPN